MKFLVLFVIVTTVAISNSTPVQKTLQYPRSYVPEEENINRFDSILIPDAKGNLHQVDLTKTDYAEPRVASSDVTFHLYTKQNINNGQPISASEFKTIASSNYNNKLQNFFIIHGWTSEYSAEVNTLIRNALLQTGNINVFVVDWSAPAAAFYTTAIKSVPKVGVIIGDFINEMISFYQLNPSQFILAGHSLGAHVAGCAGAQVAKVNGKVNSIIGLDPAGPLFTLGNRDNRLDDTDAEFVHVIHTNGGLLGFASAIGHADYYPNGGKSQPGCGIDLGGGCSHSRSYIYLAESITKSQFHAVLCDSYKNFQANKCSSNTRSILGGFAVDKSAKGDYYLTTSKSSPFGLGTI